MKKRDKKILFYIYLICSIVIILLLLFNTINLYKEIQEFRIPLEQSKMQYSDLNEKYEECMSKTCACVCPQLNPDKLCKGKIHPMCVGHWEIINECYWNCQTGKNN